MSEQNKIKCYCLMTDDTAPQYMVFADLEAVLYHIREEFSETDKQDDSFDFNVTIKFLTEDELAAIPEQ